MVGVVVAVVAGIHLTVVRIVAANAVMMLGVETIALVNVASLNKMKLFIIILSLLSTSAFAQDGDRKVVYKQKTEIDFEALNIDGELVKPQGALLLDRKKGSFNPLIKLRQDFNTEIEQSVDLIK